MKDTTITQEADAVQPLRNTLENPTETCDELISDNRALRRIAANALLGEASAQLLIAKLRPCLRDLIDGASMCLSSLPPERREACIALVERARELLDAKP